MEMKFWQTVIANDYTLPDRSSVADLTPELTGYLGSPDPILRDEIGYMVLIRWMDRGLYSPDELRALLRQLQLNLNLNLGERDTDSVFLRSFSALVLAGIVFYDNHREPFLSEDEVRGLLDAALDYFAGEADLRGYVPEKGWAHSCAHTADLLDELALNRYLNAGDLERILKAIGAKVLAPTGYVYQHDEDERLSVAVLTALNRELLSPAFVAGWLMTFCGLMERVPRKILMTEDAPHSAYLNTKNFLRCLYVRLSLTRDLPESVRALLPEVQAALRPFGVGYG